MSKSSSRKAWRVLIGTCARLHPQGRRVAIRAYLAGLDPADFSGATVGVYPDGREALHLTFGPWQDYCSPYHIVTADSVGLYKPEPALKRWLERPRGGPPIGNGLDAASS